MFEWLKKQVSPSPQPKVDLPSNVSPKEKARQKYGRFYVGKIIHFYGKIQVGIIRVEKGQLKLGDMLYIQGQQTRFKQKVTSIEYEHQKIKIAPVGYEVGIRVGAPVREGDDVYVLPKTS